MANGFAFNARPSLDDIAWPNLGFSLQYSLIIVQSKIQFYS